MFFFFFFFLFYIEANSSDVKTYFQELCLFIYQKAEYIKIHILDIFIFLFAFLFFCLQ